MNILYLDCQSGISGDMTLSALIDLGADLTYIKEQLEKLPIDPFVIDVRQVDKRGISSKELVLAFTDGEMLENVHNHHHTHHSHGGHHHTHHSHGDHHHTHHSHDDHHHAHRRHPQYWN